MTFWSALILGLIASGHCIGMCGGLQLALQNSPSDQGIVMRSQKQQNHYLLLLNSGRIATYFLAGLVFSFIGASTLIKLNIVELSYTARLFAGLIVTLIGLQILLREQRPFQFIEALGVSLWKKVSKTIDHSSNTWSTALLNGFVWGFLPCGLVYGVLLSTMFIQSPIQGALVMIGFGIGTIPALVLTGLSFHKFRSAVNTKWVQHSAAWFFIFGGALMISAPYWVSKEFLRGYPILLNSVFCIT